MNNLKGLVLDESKSQQTYDFHLTVPTYKHNRICVSQSRSSAFFPLLSPAFPLLHRHIGSQGLAFRRAPALLASHLALANVSLSDALLGKHVCCDVGHRVDTVGKGRDDRSVIAV